MDTFSQNIISCFNTKVLSVNDQMAMYEYILFHFSLGPCKESDSIKTNDVFCTMVYLVKILEIGVICCRR